MSGRSFALQIARRCVNFTGVQNKSCGKGVVYEEVFDKTKTGFERMPCFREGESVPCPHRHFPTAEEVEKETKEHEQHMERLGKASRAAHEHAKSAGLGKGSGGSGTIKCPACDSGDLRYSVSAYNGLMRAGCTTAGCVSWIE